MKWTIGDAIPEAPRQFNTGDLVIYEPNGSVYLLGRKVTNSRDDKLFDYWVWGSGTKKASQGSGGCFTDKNFKLFQGSITLSN